MSELNTSKNKFSEKSVLDNKNKQACHQVYANLNELRRLQYKTQGFSFLPNQPVNSLLSGKHVSKLRGRGLNFEELRHYRPGDDIRSMDWKVTQRTGKPHIKVYTEEKERNVFLAIDQRSTMFFGSKGKMKSVIAAEVAALMAWRIIETGDRIGAVIYNDDQIKVIPAKRGHQHVVSILSEIIKKNHQLSVSSNRTDNDQDAFSSSYNKMLMKLRNICGHNALVILIGDGHGWNEQSSDNIKQLRQHNEVIACHVFDPLEMQLPEMSQMVVSDGNWQIQFSSQDAKTQKKYQAEIARQLKTYADTAKKYRIPLLTIDTLTPVEKQVRKAFGGG